jgi:hypothetical protein
MMGLQFGIFDHIEPVPDLILEQIYRERLRLLEQYMDEYVATGANYFVCSFQWGNLTHDHAMRSIDLFVNHVMPHYVDAGQ